MSVREVSETGRATERGTVTRMNPRTRAIALATLLGTAGTLHLVKPTLFDTLVPERLPGTRRGWTCASGAAELGCAAAVAAPRTRRFGGLASAGLFAAVFPGNITMAVH